MPPPPLKPSHGLRRRPGLRLRRRGDTATAPGVTCADFAEVCVQTEARNGAAVAAPVCCHCLGFPVFGLYKVNGLGLLGQRVLGWG
ncbi:hypothetical protein V6Z11_D10G117200 [Gossypium hirsutum]